MTEIKVEDVLIPLLNNYYDEARFNQIFNSVRKRNPKTLYLEGGFGFSINFIRVINSKDLKQIEDVLDKYKIFECDTRNIPLFSWEDIKDDNKRLKEFLNKRFVIDCVKNSKIEKFDDDKTIRLTFENNIIHLKLNDDKTKVSLKIDDNRIDEFIVKLENGKLNIYQESLDDMFLKRGKYLFKRKIFSSEKEIKIRGCNFEEFSCKLFINIVKIKYDKEKDDTCHIISAILKSFNHSENGKLCNKQIIKLVNSEQNGFECFSFPNDYPEEVVKVVKKLLKKDTFVAIQLWNNRWESDEDNTFDAKTYVKENPHYFYSILTLEEEVFRRTYENIMDVLGWCQSASSVYFDVFYGTTCLELTIKPKEKIFDETGHDSEEFRIWEFLALQKKLLDKINQQEKIEHIDNCIKELDKIYNFKTFTDTSGKGEKWIKYGEYLQKITGIDSDYQDYRLKKEMKNKEHEQKLQKLNLLIIVSIFVSFLTLLSSPIYNSLVAIDNNPSFNSTINSTTNFFFTYKNLKQEIAIAIATVFALVLTCSSYLFMNVLINRFKYKLYIKINKRWKLEKYPNFVIFIVIILLIILLIIFLIIIYIFKW